MGRAAQQSHAADLAIDDFCEGGGFVAFQVQFGHTAPAARRLTRRALGGGLSPAFKGGQLEDPHQPRWAIYSHSHHALCVRPGWWTVADTPEPPNALTLGAICLPTI